MLNAEDPYVPNEVIKAVEEYQADQQASEQASKQTDQQTLQAPTTEPPKPLSPAGVNLRTLKEAIKQLPPKEIAEVIYVQDRIKYLLAQYDFSAKLAIMKVSLEIAVSEGQ